MGASVLIFSFFYDPHASAVAWALQRNGVAYRLNPSLRIDETTRLSLRIDDEVDDMLIDDMDPSHIRAIWHRRPKPPEAGHCLEADRAFIEGQWKYLQKNIFDTAHALPDALWVNRPRAADFAESKLAQLRAARASGLMIPETLISNHAPDIAALIKRWGKIVFKTFYPQSWQDNRRGVSHQMSVVALDDTSSLPEPSIAMSPGIYQRYIDKNCDIRVTVIGCQIFAVKMKNKSGEAYFDWRSHSNDEDMQAETFVPSASLEFKIRNMMQRLGIVFGCIDLVVDHHDDIYFLEVNQAGQFLFVEQMKPELQTLRAMTAMLSAGSVDYSISDCVETRLADYMATDEYREIGSVPRNTGQRIAVEPV